MYEQTNRIFPHFTGLRPLPGPLPKNTIVQQQNKKQKQKQTWRGMYNIQNVGNRGIRSIINKQHLLAAPKIYIDEFMCNVCVMCIDVPFH